MKKLVIKTSMHEAISELSEVVKNLPIDLDSKNLIFTEEKSTLIVESAIVKKLGGTFNTEVCSFGTFLHRRKEITNMISKEGASMLMRKVILNNADKLTLFKGNKIKNLAPVIYELVAQLKSAKITPEMLIEALNNSDGVLKNKLTDVAIIFSRYQKELEKNNFIDQNDSFESLPEVIENENFEKVNVFIVGFSSFTAQIRESIKVLNKKAENVTAFLIGGVNEGVFTNETINAYENILKSINVKYEKIVSEEKGIQNKILNKLFNPSVEKLEKTDTQNIFMYEAMDIREEIEHIAQIIKRDVREKSMRYFDFIVGLTDKQGYSPIIKEVFDSYEIPYYLDEKETLINQSISKLILNAISLVRKNYDKEDYISFIKNPIFNEDKSLTDSFENYVLEHAFNRNSFLKTFSDMDYERIRQKVYDLISLIPKKGKVKSIVLSIKKLLTELDANKILKSMSEKASQYGYKVKASVLLAVYDNLISVLDETEKIIGEVEIGLDEFETVLTSGLTVKEINVIPHFLDAVYVGDFKESRLVQAKYVFAIGLNSSVPSNQLDVALINDGDIEKLSQFKIMIEPKIRVVNQRQKEYLALGLTAFSNKLYLSYSLTDGNAKSCKKSEIFDYFKNGFTVNGKKLDFLNKYKIESEIRLLDKEKRNKIRLMAYTGAKQSYLEFARAVSNYSTYNESDIILPSSYYNALDENGKQKIKNVLNFANREFNFKINSGEVMLVGDNVSPTLIESFNTCPYKTFLEKGLGLEERKTGELRSLDAGNILHKVFEEYVKKIDSVTDKESSDKLVCQLFNEELKLKEYDDVKEKKENVAIFNRLRVEAVKFCYKFYLQCQSSDFKPTKVEAKIGGDNSDYPPIKIHSKDKEINLIGKVDRIDKYENYFRVIDYKTGDYDEKEKHLFSGQKLQLYLYMQAILNKEKELIPAGVYYFPIDDAYKKDGEEAKLLYGKTLDEESVLKATDKNADEKTVGENIGLKYKETKKGIKINATGLLDRKTFDSFIEYAMLISKNSVRNMQDGYVIPTPVEGGCEYCKFKGICDISETNIQERKIKKVTPTVIKDSVNNSKEKI